MAYLLFQPSSMMLEAAGFGGVAHVPMIFSEKWEYQSVASRYMRQRALGQTVPCDSGGSRIPTDQSLITFGRWLIDFLAWCDWAKTPWTEAKYTEDLILRYQASMVKGSWSVAKEALAPATINNRIDEAVNFCAWAVRVGLRKQPLNVPYEISYRKSGGLSSSSQKMVSVKSRKGKIRAAPRDLSLPTEKQVERWLSSVKAKHGQVLKMMCRLAIESGLRRQEVVEWDLEYLGTNPRHWRIRDEHVVLEIRYGTKGDKYQEQSPPGAHTANARTVGPSRTIHIPLDLAMELLEYRNKQRSKLIARFVNKAASPADKEARAAQARSWNHRLFLSEYDGRPVQAPTMLKAFKTNPPYPEWHTHLARHYYACIYILRKLRLLWSTSTPENNQPRPDWVLFQGQAAMLMLKRQLGHVSEETTEKYLVWLVHAFAVGDDYVNALEATSSQELSEQ